MIWLGEKRGYLTDWSTQLWVRATGKRLDPTDYPWLEGPVGPTRGIGRGFFEGRERIHVYPADDNDARADHVLRIWGAVFLRLHYRLRRIPPQ